MIPVDLYGSFLSAWSANVSASRARQGLPPLNGIDGNDGQIAIGQEEIAWEMAPPRITLVPKGITVSKNEMRMPNPPTLTIADNQPKVLWSAWLNFTAYFWGDEWPGDTPKPVWWDFNTTIELFREFAMALYRTCSGPSLKMDPADFEQPTDNARAGRWLVMPFSVLIPVTDEPYVTLPYGAHPKVEIDFQTSPVTGEIVIPS